MWPHGLQHTRLPCPSLWPCSNSCPLSRWCYLTISSSVAPFSSCPHSYLASGSFPMSWLFESSGQSIGASASVLPMNIQGSYPLRLTGLISLLSKGLSSIFFSPTVWKHSLKVLQCSTFFMVQLSYLYMTSGRTIALTIWTFVDKVMSLLFNMLSRFVSAFLPRSKCLNFMAAVPICSDFGAQQNKACHCFYFFPFYLPWSDGTGCPC